MVALIVLITVILIAALAFYILQKYNFRYWAKKGVVTDEPHIIFGNLGKLIHLQQSIQQFLDEQYKKYPNQPVVGFYGFSKPFLLIRDQDLIMDITTKDFSNFMNRVLHPGENVDPLASRVMFTSRNDRWKSIRTKSSTSFSSGKLRAMYPQVKAVGDELLQVCSDRTKSGAEEIDIRDYSMRYTVDVITSCAFGLGGNAVKNPDTSILYHILGKALSFDFKQGVSSNLLFFARPAYFFFGKFGFKLFPKFIEDNLYKIVQTAYNQRVEEKIRKSDIFDQIVWSPEPAFQGIENKSAAAFQMLVAGSETSASTITFALYELARDTQSQNRLRAEINETLEKNNGVIDYDIINKMEFLDLVVKETLRLWPVVPFMDRCCEKAYRLAGTNITVDKGTHIFIPIYSIQRDPAFYSEPDRFKPERFKKENMEGLPKLAYIPFGAGPRYCVGKRFGIMSVKNFLVQFLPRYEVRLTNESSKELQWNTKSFTLSLKDGMKLHVSPLKNKST